MILEKLVRFGPATHQKGQHLMGWVSRSSTAAWVDQLRGKFLVFEGPDGSGKSTQFRRFVQFAHEHGLETCEVREPGGTAIGEQIRDVLLDPANADMDVTCEMLLYMASRAQLIAQTVGPAIQAGQLVLADRFISSTLAYQGTAGGLAVQDILRVGQIALGSCWPDLVIVFDVDEKTAGTRLNPLLDRMEQKGSAYHQRVRQGYLDQVQADPARHLLIDARPPAGEIFEVLTQNLQKWLSI